MPEQICDQLLGVMVVAEHLRPDALDAKQASDRLAVLALPSVRNGRLEMNLAAAPHEPRGEPFGVDLARDLDSAVRLIEPDGCRQCMGAHVGWTEPGPRVVAVRAETPGEALGISEVPAARRLNQPDRMRRSLRSAAGRRAQR